MEMKKIFLLTDADWLKAIWKTKKELKKEFKNNRKSRWYLDKIKEYTIWKYVYDGEKYDYDWWYGDFWIFEKWNDDNLIDYDDYEKYGIIAKEIKKDFLYLKNY